MNLLFNAGGYIYDGKEAFDKLPNSYRCPVCNAPKRR
jgi:rubredoxin